MTTYTFARKKGGNGERLHTLMRGCKGRMKSHHPLQWLLLSTKQKPQSKVRTLLTFMAKHLQSYICRDLENLFLFMFSSLFN